MPSDSPVLGLKRPHIDDEPSLKRARAVAEEPEEDIADQFVERLVFGIRASGNLSDARSFAESQLRPVLAKTQRQTEATRVLFKALQTLQTRTTAEAEKLKTELKTAQDRATAAERHMQTLLWQLRAQPVRGNSFPGSDPGVF